MSWVQVGALIFGLIVGWLLRGESLRRKSRVWLMGIDSGEELVAPGETRTVESEVQRGFRPNLLKTAPGDFLVGPLLFDGKSTFVCDDSIPSQVFSEGLKLDLPKARRGVVVSVEVFNCASAPARFQATLIGPS